MPYTKAIQFPHPPDKLTVAVPFEPPGQVTLVTAPGVTVNAVGSVSVVVTES